MADKNPRNSLDELLGFLLVILCCQGMAIGVLEFIRQGRALDHNPAYWCRGSVEADRLLLWAPTVYADICDEVGVTETVFSEIGFRASYAGWIQPGYYGLEL